MKNYFFLLLLIVSFASCNEKPVKKQVAAKPDTVESWKENDSNSKILRFANFRMIVPQNWIRVKPESNLSVIEFKVQGNSEILIKGYYFGKQTGMEQTNIDRWMKEYSSINYSSSIELDNGVTYIRINGTFKKKPYPMAQEYEETDGYSTLAAIAPSDDGPYYFKLVGESKIVNQEESNFKEFLNSYTSY